LVIVVALGVGLAVSQLLRDPFQAVLALSLTGALALSQTAVAQRAMSRMRKRPSGGQRLVASDRLYSAVRLTPEGLAWGPDEDQRVRWDEVRDVEPTMRPGAFSDDPPRIFFVHLHLADGRAVEVDLSETMFPPQVSLFLLRHYWTHPEARPKLDSWWAFRRLARRAYLADVVLPKHAVALPAAGDLAR